MAQQRLQVEMHSWWWLLTRTQIPMLKNNITVTVKQLHNSHLYLGTEEYGHCREVVITWTFPIYINFFHFFLIKYFFKCTYYFTEALPKVHVLMWQILSPISIFIIIITIKKSKQCNYYYLIQSPLGCINLAIIMGRIKFHAWSKLSDRYITIALLRNSFFNKHLECRYANFKILELQSVQTMLTMEKWTYNVECQYKQIKLLWITQVGSLVIWLLLAKISWCR